MVVRAALKTGSKNVAWAADPSSDEIEIEIEIEIKLENPSLRDQRPEIRDISGELAKVTSD